MFFEWLDRVMKTERLLPVMAVIGVLAYIFWSVNSTPITNVLVEKGIPLYPNGVAQESEIELRHTVKQSEGVADNKTTRKEAQQILAREKLERELKSYQTGNLAGRTNELAFEFSLMKSAFEKWTLHLTELSLNDRGRMIVSNTTVLPTVLTMFECQEKLRADFSSLTDEANAIVKASKEALDSSPEFLGSKEILNTIMGTTGKVQSMRLAIEKLENALSSFETASAGLIPADRTLAMALQDRQKADAIADAKALDEAREVSRAEFAAKKKEAVREKEKLEFLREQAIELAEQKRLKDEIEDTKEKAAKATLLAEFNRDLPQIKHYLGKFFMIGYTQPSSCHYFEDVGKQGPVSYARVVAVGALNEKVEGLEGAYSALLHLMNASNNDRKLVGPYPGYIGGAVSTQNAAAIRPAYLLLKKYGRLLVEKGYLQE